MVNYQVISRKYRPQRFEDVVGHPSIVVALKNALLHKRIAHAYLFSGTRGTGKTTLARLFCKALNCQHLNDHAEPCNNCPPCLEFVKGSSLNVLEIDGASHRGIDDIRQLNESVGYAPASGAQYKMYLIDEVHMLTKEAFNALLKTLEEPPPGVIFFFATTEPHKVPATILSRCQRFQLQRLQPEQILSKLAFIVDDLKLKAEKEALKIIADMAEGGMRDAESMLDQALTACSGELTVQEVNELLGLVPSNLFFALDRAIASYDLSFAFQASEQILTSGKDLPYFLQHLCDHFRHLLAYKLLADKKRQKNGAYEEVASLFTKEQCLELLEIATQAWQQMARPRQTSLDALFLRLIRSYQKISPEMLLQRLEALENTSLADAPALAIKPADTNEAKKEKAPSPAPSNGPAQTAPLAQPPAPSLKACEKTPQEAAPPFIHPSRYDTLLRFTAVEMEGTAKIATKIERK